MTYGVISDDSDTKPALVRAGIFVLRKYDPGMHVVPAGRCGFVRCDGGEPVYLCKRVIRVG